MTIDVKIELLPILPEDFQMIYSEMEKNFISEERRDRELAKAILEDEKYTVYNIFSNSLKVGFIALWHLTDYRFIEHFVIYEEFRNRGLGALSLLKLKELFPNLVLEAELPIEKLASRRVKFYERCGFKLNPQNYIQPPYRDSDDGTPLVIMSYPDLLESFTETVSELYKTVYKKNYTG